MSVYVKDILNVCKSIRNEYFFFFFNLIIIFTMVPQSSEVKKETDYQILL